MEILISPIVKTPTRKRKRTPEKWEKNFKKRLRNSKEIKLSITEPQKSCDHNVVETHCQVAALDDEDIQAFFDLVYEKPNCEDQNRVLMTYMVPLKPKRCKSKKENPRPRIAIQYLVRKRNGELYNVCAKSFCSIVCMDRKRLNRLCTHFIETGNARKEERGGARFKESKQLAKESIMEFLSNLKPTESHYGRGKSCRFYLSPLLNVHRLWLMWSTQYKNENPDGDTISYQYFDSIFNSEFNLAFGSPRTDICSTCANLENRVNGGGQIGEAAALELQVHKLESKHFIELYNAETAECSTFTACFDIQQNFPLPKSNIGEVFYKRQMWMYNLGIVCSNFSKEYNDVQLYTWLENEAGKGGNEVVSVLMNFLAEVTNEASFKLKKYQKLSLFSDSCPAQNKNYSMIMALLLYVNSPNCPFRKIKFTFPVRGHSYMAPDRVFGRIEKQLKRHEQLLTPDDYYPTLEEHGTVHKYGPSWKVFDYKNISDSALKRNVFPIQKSKRWGFKKGSTSVWCSTDYTGSYTRYDILKKNLEISSFKPRLLPKKSHIKEAKKKDVREILKLLNPNANVMAFYESAFRN